MADNINNVAALTALKGKELQDVKVDAESITLFFSDEKMLFISTGKLNEYRFNVVDTVIRDYSFTEMVKRAREQADRGA